MFEVCTFAVQTESLLPFSSSSIVSPSARQNPYTTKPWLNFGVGHLTALRATQKGAIDGYFVI